MKRCGFFSVELTICIVISLLLVATAVYKGGEYLNNGRIAKATAETARFSASISQYKFEVGTYPDRLEDLRKKVGQYGPWITNIPKDPWNQSYQYQHVEDGFAVWSSGKDGISRSNGKEVKNGDIGFIGK